MSGNVSLYNETLGEAIPPTPTIAGVGLIPDWQQAARAAFAAEGEAIVLIGAPEGWGTHLGQSVYLRDIHGRAEGPPPPVDLAHEKRTGDLVRGLIRSGALTATHDCSDGGLAVALAEMAIASGIGATIDAPKNAIPAFFGEDQGRYVATTAKADAVLSAARTAGVAAVIIGTTGGDVLALGDAAPVPVTALKEAHEAWFPHFMDGA